MSLTRYQEQRRLGEHVRSGFGHSDRLWKAKYVGYGGGGRDGPGLVTESRTATIYN